MADKPIHAVLGATHPVGSEQVTLFIPSKDQLGQAIDQDFWTDEALATLGRLFRGATAFPPGKGVWRDDAKGGALLEANQGEVGRVVSGDYYGISEYDEA